MKIFKSKSLLLLLMLIFAELICQAAIAGFSSAGNVAKNVTDSMEGLARLATAGAYVAGFGFAVAAILKFKAHKDNPTQIPVGTPVALLLIAVALIFIPTIFGVTGTTLFGSGAQETGTVKGVITFGKGSTS